MNHYVCGVVLSDHTRAFSRVPSTVTEEGLKSYFAKQILRYTLGRDERSAEANLNTGEYVDLEMR